MVISPPDRGEEGKTASEAGLDGLSFLIARQKFLVTAVIRI